MNFREFEHDGWEKLPQRYHESFASLTTQAVAPLLDAVAARSGTRLLDVATGPGYVAAAAAQRGASVVGVDFATAMVAEAKRLHPEIEFQEGDAEKLPFPEDAFDAVTINFGMLHFADPERALREAHRVLRPGGRAGFTVWAKPYQARGFGIVLDAIQEHGDTSARIPPGPPFFRFSEPGECRRVLEEAGFTAPQFTTVPQTWWLDTPGRLFEVMLGSTVRTGALLRSQTPEALAAIRAAVDKAVPTHKRSVGKIAVPMPAVLASAMKQ